MSSSGGAPVPNLVGKVAAAETAHFFRTSVFAVEEPSGSEVVGLLIHLELPVGSEGLFRVVFQIAQVIENILGRGTLPSSWQHRVQLD